MKRGLKILAASILVIVIFRGQLYRSAVNYTQIRERQTVKITNERLILEIENEIEGQALNHDKIAEIARGITNKNLQFNWTNSSGNPNELFDTQQANCIGYSALFNSIVQYLIDQNRLGEIYETKHLVGRLEFWGIDVHLFFDSPFFRDHDYNSIKNIETGKILFIDPSASDYLKVHQVN